jgi:glucokinase
MMKKILTADIGGTNSRFACFEIDSSGNIILSGIQWLRTGESSSFHNLLSNLKASDFPLKPEEADVSVLAIAGPVEGRRRSAPPFITWDIDVSNAADDYGLKTTILINDFVAQAYACHSSAGDNAELIKHGNAVPNAATAVIGAGTALGKAVTMCDESGRLIAIPSEGGHASFPFVSHEECEFQKFLIRKLGDTYITWNKVVSGTGLSYIHEFLTGDDLGPAEVISKILPDTQTLEWAARFYGRACRDFALETLALGGLFITGGVAARTPELVTHEAFTDEFLSSDTLGHILSGIPIRLITDQNAGLLGCAVLGSQELNKG